MSNHVVELPEHKSHFAYLARVVQDGEDAKAEQVALIRKLRKADPEYFTHAVLGEISGLSQQMVSYYLKKKP